MGPSPKPKISHPRQGVERVTFTDTGDWWEFKTIFTVAMEREWLGMAISAAGENVDIRGLAEVVDQLMVSASVSWSYGPPKPTGLSRLKFWERHQTYPLDTHSLRHHIPSYHHGFMAERMGDYYSPLVERSAERLVRNCSSLLKGEQTSPKSSPMRS